jgi:hypothetical protein
VVRCVKLTNPKHDCCHESSCAEALLHYLTDVLGATELERPYISVVGYHCCKSLAAFTKLTLGQLSEQFKYTKKDGSTGSISFAASELNELIELQEFVWNFKHEADHDWLAETAEDFIRIQDTLVEDPKHAKPAVATVSGAVSSRNKGYQMKRQYSDYREITKRHFFSSWEKELKVTAITQLQKSIG